MCGVSKCSGGAVVDWKDGYHPRAARGSNRYRRTGGTDWKDPGLPQLSGISVVKGISDRQPLARQAGGQTLRHATFCCPIRVAGLSPLALTAVLGRCSNSSSIMGGTRHAVCAPIPDSLPSHRWCPDLTPPIDMVRTGPLQRAAEDPPASSRLPSSLTTGTNEYACSERRPWRPTRPEPFIRPPQKPDIPTQ